MAIRKHSNNYSSTLNGAITDVATSLTVTSATGLPAIGSGEVYNLTLDDGAGTIEIVTVTDDASSPTLTITRGAEGTSNVAWDNGSTIELRPTANSLDRKQDQTASAGEDIDFSVADSFKIPISGAPDITIDGHIGIDNNVTDFSHGILKYYDGEELGVVSMPITQFTSPTDGYVVAYNATNDEFELVAQSGGSGTPGGSNTQLQYNNSGSFGGISTLTYDGTNITATRGFIVDGSEDEIQVRIQGNATQTSEIFVIETSAGTDLFTVDNSGNVGVSGTVDGRDLATDGTKLDGIESAADVTDETNVKAALDGATITGVTVATGDKVLIQDISDSDNLRTVTAQSIADLASGSGDCVLIGSATASSDATIDFTGLSSTYYTYCLVFENLLPATDNVDLYLRTDSDNGASFDAGSSDYNYGAHLVNSGGTETAVFSTGTAQIRLTFPVGNAAGEGVSGHCWLYNPSAANELKVSYSTHFRSPSGTYASVVGGGVRATAADVDAIRLLFSSGNIASGTVRLYGFNAS